LAAQLLQKKKTRMHWSDVVKKHAVLIHNINIRVDRLIHAGIKEVPRHDLDLETGCADNITTQRNYVITSYCCRTAQTFIWSSAKIKTKWMPQQSKLLTKQHPQEEVYGWGRWLQIILRLQEWSSLRVLIGWEAGTALQQYSFLSCLMIKSKCEQPRRPRLVITINNWVGCSIDTSLA
jgi:hypothetical protein